jgi:hypothetical protein
MAVPNSPVADAPNKIEFLGGQKSVGTNLKSGAIPKDVS